MEEGLRLQCPLPSPLRPQPALLRPSVTLVASASVLQGLSPSPSHYYAPSAPAPVLRVREQPLKCRPETAIKGPDVGSVS